MQVNELKVDYKELYNTAPCGYLCTLPNGKVIEVNNRFLEFTDYQREEIINGKYFTDFLTKASKIYYESSFAVILKLQGSVKELSFSLLKKDSSTIPVLINSSVVKNEFGESIYIQSTIFDISQRKKFENQLLVAKKNAERLNQELLELNDELENLAYLATHDLKSPILDIEGHFNFLRDKISLNDSSSEESIKFVDQGIEQFKTTINGLTDTIRIKHLEFGTENTYISKEIENLIPKIKYQIKELGGVLDLKIEKEVLIRGNKVHVFSILQNIIENAIKYRSTNRILKLEIMGKTIKNFYCLKIKDNGTGINLEKHKGRLFKMFDRLNSTVNGSGMGLYISKKMIEKAGGKIEVNSEIGVGSEFKLYFKLSK